MADGSVNLFSKFLVGNGSENLQAEFRLRQAIYNLSAEFEVKHSENLFAKSMIRHTTELEFDACFYVERTWKDLFAKTRIINYSSATLKNIITVKHETSVNLQAEFIVGQENADLKGVFIAVPVKELYAQFEVNQYNATKTIVAFFRLIPLHEELKAEFTLRQLTSNLRATCYIGVLRDMYSLIGYNMPMLLNHVESIGRGFIGSPAPLTADPGYEITGRVPVKVESIAGPHQYKEIQFGWKKEPFYDMPQCVPGTEFILLAQENWGGYEEVTINYGALKKDNTLMCEYNEHFGAGSLYLVLDNYGSAEWLGLSSFAGWLAGELPSYRHQWWTTIAMKWALDGFAGIDLNRFAWARCEIYRYGRNGGIPGGPIKIYRMPDCQDIDERGSPPVMGGCNLPGHTSTGIGEAGTWTELSSDYQIMGYSEIDHTFNRHYGNLSFYADPSDGIGFSWENSDWDKIDLSTLMLGWLNGTYNNHGMFLHMDTDVADFVPYSYYNFKNYLLYYSRHSSNPNKPIIRIMLQPLDQKWLFQNQRKWSINTVDPYSGSACLRLKDWSKKSYTDIGTEHGGRPGFSLNNELPAEGCIDTAFRLNNATVKRVDQYTDHTVVDWWKYQEGTPRNNYFNVYFRYQDESNHYRVMFNKRGTNCKIERERSGAVTTLATFSGSFDVGVWAKIRITFIKTAAGDLKICCYKWNEYSNTWIHLADATESTEYWPEGGKIQFEGLDCDVDETDVWEVS